MFDGGVCAEWSGVECNLSCLLPSSDAVLIYDPSNEMRRIPVIQRSFYYDINASYLGLL